MVLQTLCDDKALSWADFRTAFRVLVSSDFMVPFVEKGGELVIAIAHPKYVSAFPIPKNVGVRHGACQTNPKVRQYCCRQLCGCFCHHADP